MNLDSPAAELARGALKAAALAVALALASAYAGQARAANPNAGGTPSGVITIDQSKAEAGGVTSGDAPGFPVTISQPGSYRLTSNLVVPDAYTTAIVIASSNVTLDLSGFSIIGPATCSGTPTACSPVGQGDGIALTFASAARAGVTLMNGTIRGLGRFGVANMSSALDGVRVERVMTINNGGGGLLVPSGSVVVDSQASFNGGNGIGGNGLVLMNNVVRGNGNVGVLTNAASVGAGNVLQGNSYSNLLSNTMKNLGPNWCDSALCP